MSDPSYQWIIFVAVTVDSGDCGASDDDVIMLHLSMPIRRLLQLLFLIISIILYNLRAMDQQLLCLGIYTRLGCVFSPTSEGRGIQEDGGFVLFTCHINSQNNIFRSYKISTNL